MAKRKPTKMLAVLGRSRRSGNWTVPGRTSVVAVLGGCGLDMRHSRFEADQVRLKVTVLLGSAEFVLPPGASVSASGTSLLAGSLVEVPEPEDDDQPSMEIEWTVVLGRIHITTADATTDGG